MTHPLTHRVQFLPHVTVTVSAAVAYAHPLARGAAEVPLPVAVEMLEEEWRKSESLKPETPTTHE